MPQSALPRSSSITLPGGGIEMASNPEITVFSKTRGILTKKISLSEDGNVIADGSACRMSNGRAERTAIADLHTLAAVIEDLKPSQAIALGTLRPDLPDEIPIVSKKNLNGGEAIARIQENIIYRKNKPALVLLDFDRKAMPAEVRERLGEFWETLVAIVPGLREAAHLVRQSTSAGLYRTDTGERIEGLGGTHGYVVVRDGGDVDRFLHDFHDRAWLKDYGWWMISKAGSLLERSIIDRSVGTPERLVFEAAPELEKPLARDEEKRRPIVTDGEVLDTYVACPPLTPDERRAVDKIKLEAKERIQPEADKVRAAYVEEHAPALAKRTGKSIEEARQIIESQCGGVLLPDHVLEFFDKELKGCTVGDVLKDPERFKDRALADPIEGVSYGRQTAKVMLEYFLGGYNGPPFINSFAHGGMRYTLAREPAAADAPSIVPAQGAIGDKPRSGPGPRNDIVTEDSAAIEFVDENADKLRYCHSTGSWFQWDGNIWRREDTQLAFHWARLLARRLGENEDKKARGAIGKTAFASGVEKFAQRDRAMAVTVAYWDCDQWLLGTPAGTVDLRTGKLRPSDPTDGITKSTLVAPADTGRVLWMKFLGETTGGDAELIRFLQQWLGYCLTGSTREHALIFLYGGGGNGKGVFLNTTARIFGDYAATAAMDTFAVSKNERHPTDLAMLRGARIVTASETEEGRAWAEARIKALTGGDKISARFMRQDFFEYYPQFKLTIIGNHKPVLRTVDDAMRRRINMIPFLLKPPVIDRQLEDKLLTEAPGILQWMIDGCLDWQANGLIRPAVVQAATSEYFSEQDLFGHWIEECCEVALGRNPPTWGLSGSLFASWAEYCRKANELPRSQKTFANEMRKRGFEPFKATGGVRAFKGVRLKDLVSGG